MFQFKSIFNKPEVDPEHLSLIKQLVDLYVDKLIPSDYPTENKLELALNYGSLCKPGWFVIETDKPVGVVSAIEHQGNIQIDVAFLPEVQNTGLPLKAFKLWCEIIRDTYPTTPITVDVETLAGRRFYTKAGFIQNNNTMIYPIKVLQEV